MGLDILVVTDNYGQLVSEKPNDYFEQHSLSRTLCNFTIQANSIGNGGLKPYCRPLARSSFYCFQLKFR